MQHYKEYFVKGEIVFNQDFERKHYDALREFSITSGLLTQTNPKFVDNKVIFNKPKAHIDEFNVSLGRGKYLQRISFEEVLEVFIQVPILAELEPSGIIVAIETGSDDPRIARYEIGDGKVKCIPGKIIYRDLNDKVI